MLDLLSVKVEAVGVGSSVVAHVFQMSCLARTLNVLRVTAEMNGELYTVFASNQVIIQPLSAGNTQLRITTVMELQREEQKRQELG